MMKTSPRTGKTGRWLSLMGAAAATGLVAQSVDNASPAAPAAGATDEEVVVLTPFEVNSSTDTGYVATETLAGTRIRTELKDVASSISVITKEFMADVGATDNATLLQYATNTEVGGTRGNFSGLAIGAKTAADYTPISTSQRIRGLESADQTMDFFKTNVPWDSYNIDRIDIQRGPNSILFGLGSPSGIINATTRNANFRNSGSVEARVGSFGSYRGAIDVNQELIDEVLAIRVDGLWNKEKYQQDPAFKKDRRIYTALRWDPKIFGRDFATSFKAKYESGKIDANLPRQNTPYDNISAWFRTNEANKLTIGGGTNYSVYDVGAAPAAISPWLSGRLGQQSAGYVVDGSTGELSRVLGGYINGGFLNNNGTVRGWSDGAVGLRYSEQLFGLNNLSAWAVNAKVPFNAQFKDSMLMDSSVFDFYNQLIDGDNKGEWSDWNAFNLSFSQTAFKDRLGLEVAYYNQAYKTGGWSLLGGTPTINVDVTKELQDGTTNPNYGRAFLASGSGGTGNWHQYDVESWRASLFGELRTSDLTDNKFLVKLLGRHRFNGVISHDKFNSYNLGWLRYTNDTAWNTYISGDANKAFDYNTPQVLAYLGSSLAGATSLSGAELPGLGKKITLNDSPIYVFDSTWTATGVTPSAAWTPTGVYTERFGATATAQASNPENYRGWTTSRTIGLDRYEDGNDLYNSGSKVEQIVKSYAGSWQGYLWNDSLVGTLGWRYDVVKQRSITAKRSTVAGQHSHLVLSDDVYKLPEYTPSNYYKGHSVSGGVVFHVNKALPKTWERNVPLNVSLSYNDSSNFQASSTRVDVFGTPIANPAGDTKEFGLLLSTKDNRFSLRAIKYKTKVTGATESTENGFAGVIVNGMNWRNIFLYRMTGYDWNSRALASSNGTTTVFNGQTVTYNTRWFWTPAYIKNDRPVATIYAGPPLYANDQVPAYDYLETPEQAATRRDQTISAWNEIQGWLDEKGYFQAWGFSPTTLSKLTTRSTYASTATVGADGKEVSSAWDPDTTKVVDYRTRWSTPQGYAITSDRESEGYEFEATANILPNWRVAFNAAKTTAVYANIGGGALEEMVTYLDGKMAGAAGDLRMFNGDYQYGNEVRRGWATFMSNWAYLKLKERIASSELRKWRFNVITNYDFRSGWAKGVNVGAAYRWQDKIVIGYPIANNAAGLPEYDIENPVYGPSEDGFDFWIGYQRKLTEKLNWKIQLNIRNAFDYEGLIPISVQPDGKTWAGVRIKPVQEWSVTNTFSF